jgi:hypothetical protein
MCDAAHTPLLARNVMFISAHQNLSEGRTMTKAIWIAVLACLLPTLAFADDGPTVYIPYADWITFALALMIIAWWSNEAFDRPSLKLAGYPTYPRYMTRPNQYHLGKILFVLLSLLIYALMAYYHKDLPRIIGAINPEWKEPLKSLVDDKNPSYLVILIVVSACFVTLLKVEKKWNIYLLFRDIIYFWVAIPYLTDKIVYLTRKRLAVPASARSALPKAHPEWRVHETDFDKNSLSMDRAWAELCYLQWWILEQYRVSTDSTFFSEESFSWDDLNLEFANLNLIVVAHKEGVAGSDDQSSETMKQIASHRKKLGRLIACYLVFMNSTRTSLIIAAHDLGIDLGPAPSENPLRYSAIYIIALIMAVYLGVYFSAVTYDLLHGTDILTATIDQNTEYVQNWGLLAFGDYGVPILGILILRYVMWRVSPVREYTIIVSYAWIFLLAAVLSTVGLSVMSEFVGRYAHQWDKFLYVCVNETRWAIGPALICVYINHFLDRQIDPTRPNIGPPHENQLLRIGHALLFTLLVVASALPSIPAIHAREDSPWEVSKLRFVSMGTIFFITMAMSLAAQFALAKRASKKPAISAPPDSPALQLGAASPTPLSND